MFASYPIDFDIDRFLNLFFSLSDPKIIPVRSSLDQNQVKSALSSLQVFDVTAWLVYTEGVAVSEISLQVPFIDRFPRVNQSSIQSHEYM